MKPYYQHAGITIYHGDCREFLPHLTADVLVTDPPYGIGLTRKTSDYRGSGAFDNGASLEASVAYADDPADVAEMLSEVIPLALSRVERALVFPGQAQMWVYPKPATVGCVYLPNGAGRTSWGFQCMQPIFFYGKDPWLQDGKGGRPNSFRTEQPNTEKIDHPCPKPISWMKWALWRTTRDGETVVDPFVGSGTTLVAAKDRGLGAIGIEREERYCEIAARRLSQEVLSL